MHTTHQTRHHPKVSKTSASLRAGTSARQGGMARSTSLTTKLCAWQGSKSRCGSLRLACVPALPPQPQVMSSPARVMAALCFHPAVTYGRSWCRRHITSSKQASHWLGQHTSVEQRKVSVELSLDSRLTSISSLCRSGPKTGQARVQPTSVQLAASNVPADAWSQGSRARRSSAGWAMGS